MWIALKFNNHLISVLIYLFFFSWENFLCYLTLSCCWLIWSVGQLSLCNRYMASSMFLCTPLLVTWLMRVTSYVTYAHTSPIYTLHTICIHFVFGDHICFWHKYCQYDVTCVTVVSFLACLYTSVESICSYFIRAV